MDFANGKLKNCRKIFKFEENSILFTAPKRKIRPEKKKLRTYSFAASGKTILTP